MAKPTVADKKESLGWKQYAPCCSNCEHFTSELVTSETRYGSFTKEKNKRCSQGGFATGKSNWCRHHREIVLFV